MPWPSARYKTAAPGGTWTPDDMNGWQDQFIRPDGLVADDLSSVLAGQLGVNQTGIARRGYAEALAEQTSTLPVNMPVVTFGAAASLYLVYYELDLRAAPATSATVAVLDGGLNQLSAAATPVSSTYSTVRPGQFIVITTPPASNRLTLRVSVTAGTYTVQNVKLWVISQNF